MKKPFIMLMMSSCLLSTPSIAQVVVNDPVATSHYLWQCSFYGSYSGDDKSGV